MKKFLLVLLCLSLVGCATNTYSVKKGFVLDSISQESLVIGKMSIIGFWYYNRGCDLYVRSLDTDRRYRIKNRSNLGIYAPERAKGRIQNYYFFVNLPPGEYRVFGIYILGGGGTYYKVPIGSDLKFSVEPRSVVYIGTLKILTSTRPNYWNRTILDCSVIARDEADEVIEELRIRYPDIKDEVKISLIEFNEEEQRQ